MSGVDVGRTPGRIPTTDVVSTPLTKKQVSDKPKESSFVTRSNSKPRATQKRLMTESPLSEKLKGKGISRDTLISSKGLKLILEKPGKIAKGKDSQSQWAARHTKLSKFFFGDMKMRPSHLMESIRLADNYQDLKKSGAPESEKLAVLKQLKSELDQHDSIRFRPKGLQTLLIETKWSKWDPSKISKDSDVSRLSDFVDAEIQQFPSEHFSKGEKALKSFDFTAKAPGQLKTLKEARDHLMAAQEGGHESPDLDRYLGSVNEMIGRLMLSEYDPHSTSSHQDKMKELVEIKSHLDEAKLAGNDNPKLDTLRDDIGRRIRYLDEHHSDPVADSKAREEHEKFMDDMREKWDGIQKQPTFEERLRSQGTRLKKVETREYTPLERAKQQTVFNEVVEKMRSDFRNALRVKSESLKKVETRESTPLELAKKEREFNEKLKKLEKEQDDELLNELSKEVDDEIESLTDDELELLKEISGSPKKVDEDLSGEDREMLRELDD